MPCPLVSIPGSSRKPAKHNFLAHFLTATASYVVGYIGICHPHTWQGYAIFANYLSCMQYNEHSFVCCRQLIALCMLISTYLYAT